MFFLAQIRQAQQLSETCTGYDLDAEEPSTYTDSLTQFRDHETSSHTLCPYVYRNSVLGDVVAWGVPRSKAVCYGPRIQHLW